MNKLEEAIISGAKAAQKDYINMANGYYLSHGPESFLQHAIAMKINKQMGLYVFPEASPSKIMREREATLKGINPKYQRFDLVIWQKSNKDDIKAIIEIKRAWDISPLFRDQEKIAKFLRTQKYVKSGYLLAYTDAKESKRNTRVDTLSRRLNAWKEGLNSTLVGSYIDTKSDKEWGWALGLFKVKLL